uniref:Uncharacterized protein n=1 Tax=Candidatus Kentrum sp. FW TaxID=2126338 RepID=A0A450U3L7_9GAMM|nr:MAG: hypothetical protein BECKFW1821C_GA0114237_11392 [Candidatus Kentron sp. FW]
MDEDERRRFDKHMDYARSGWGMIASIRREGREKRRQEVWEIAAMLKQRGWSSDQIMEMTGISPDKIFWCIARIDP